MAIDTAQQSRSVLDEDRLRQISRSIRTFVPYSQHADSDIDHQLKDFRLLLDDAFYTSSVPNLSVTHRVAAWNTLCSLIDQSSESPLPQTRDTVWNDGVWSRAFELYLHHAQNARPKSSRQLLATLTNTLRKSADRDLSEVKRNAANKLVSALLDFEDSALAKVCAQLLGQLLAKDVLDIDHVLQAYRETATSPKTHSEAEQFLAALFGWLGKGDFGSTIAHLVSVILDRLSYSGKQTLDQPIWSKPLEHAFARGSVNTDDLRAHVLPALFKRSFHDFVSFLQGQDLDASDTHSDTLAKDSPVQEELLFAGLQTGKELGLLDETDGGSICRSGNTLQIPVRYIGDLMLRSSRPARVTGFYLLVTSRSTTKPFSQKALGLIRKGLGVVFADVDADFRGDVFGVFQKLVDRLRSITATLARQNTGSNGPLTASKGAHDAQSAGEILSNHRSFLKWLLKFLCWQLRPTTSYQRHISALKCLNTLVKSGLDDSISRDFYSKSALGGTKWPFHMQLLSKEMQRLLLDRILDPFDDVRQMASAILAMVSSNASQNSERTLHGALERAEALMLETGRADQADGVAHLYALRNVRTSGTGAKRSEQSISNRLLDRLEQMMSIGRRSLSEAVARYPIHGLLTSLRYVLSQNQDNVGNLLHRLHDDLAQIWEIVKPVLCNDAPEGFNPDEVEEGLDSTKETLSYCWRALKEASLLMSTLVASRQLHDTELDSISNLCFTQLAELRHRGAFSTVAQTWMTCCMQCKDVKSPSGTSILEIWYMKTLEMLRTNVTINTRRSAGIPSLLCGILIADKSHGLLSKAVTDLETIARRNVDPAAAEDGSLPQVHAMNCLKDVLKNTRLGEQSERYVPVTLQLAADALRSDVWGIRNCGLMLFRAVIDRLLGTDQSHFDDDYASQKHISVHQHPQLIDVILGLLPQITGGLMGSSTRYESVFPALQLLQHTQVPEHRFAEVKTAVERLIASPSWHVRDKAARSLAALMAREPQIEALEGLQNLLEQNFASQNALHGALLTALHYIRRLAYASQISHAPSLRTNESCDERTLRSYKILQDEMWRIGQQSHCFVTRAAALDVIRAYEEMQLYLGESIPRPDAADALATFPPQDLEDPAKATLRQAAARLMAQRLSAAVDLADEEASVVVEWALKLARQDQNACEHFLRSLRPTKSESQGTKDHTIRSICVGILGSELGIHLKCEAQDVLLTLPTSSWSGIPEQSREYLEGPGCNQRYADNWLRSRAVQLDTKARGHCKGGADVIEDIIAWVDDCVVAIAGNGLHTREAAALAIHRIDHLWRLLAINRALEDQFTRLYISVYDLLNDDDEDTRLRAASMTQRILAADSADQVHDLEPITASHKLLEFCVTRLSSSAIIAESALTRAFDMTSLLESPVDFVSVAEQLQALTRSDTALFMEEKQNLYIDEAREVRVWTQVLQRTSARAISRTIFRGLASWVFAGLETFAKHAEKHPDGALGWSSKPDVFKLALQVIYGAELLLKMVNRGVRLPVRPSEVKRRLFECAIAFEKANVSCLVRWEIDRVLSDSVTQKLTLVHERITAVGRGLSSSNNS